MPEGIGPKQTSGHSPTPASHQAEERTISEFQGRKITSYDIDDNQTVSNKFENPKLTSFPLKKRIIRLLKQIFALLAPRKAVLSQPVPNMENWMERIYSGDRRTTTLGECTMLGSHDSASHNLVSPRPLKPLATAQSLDIEKQAEAGIRFFDIRIKPDGHGDYIVHHGVVGGLSARKEAIEPLSRFLKEHPKEAVIVKFQFSGMTRDQVKAYMAREVDPLLSQHCQKNHNNGSPIDPGEITFEDIHNSGRNLVVTISDENMSEKFTQADLGDKAWLHADSTFDNWANTSSTKEMLKFNHKKVQEFQEAKTEGDTRLHILQMQTNVDLRKPFTGGLRSMKSLARSANTATPEAIRQWHQTLDYKPNIILQDFVGQYNHEKSLLTCLAFNTFGMTEAEIKQAFPKKWRELIATRKRLRREPPTAGKNMETSL